MDSNTVGGRHEKLFILDGNAMWRRGNLRRRFAMSNNMMLRKSHQ